MKLAVRKHRGGYYTVAIELTEGLFMPSKEYEVYREEGSTLISRRNILGEREYLRFKTQEEAIKAAKGVFKLKDLKRKRERDKEAIPDSIIIITNGD